MALACAAYACNLDNPLTMLGKQRSASRTRFDAVDELRVVEYDKGEQEAILRSAQPQEDEKGMDYWEATVKPNETTVQRYRKTHDEPDRAVVVEPLSYGILGELVDQVADAVAPGLSSETTGDEVNEEER